LGGADPESVTSKRAAQEAKVVKLKAVLATLGDDGEFAAQRESFEAKLSAAEAALAKTEKDTPTPGHDLKAYRKAKATLELSMQEKRDRQAAGAAKTQERRQFRGKHIQDLLQQLKLLADGLTDLDKIVDAAHRDRLAAREAHDAKVLQLFNDKITALEVAPVLNAPVPPVVPPAQATLAEHRLPDALALALPAGPSSSAAGGIANLDQLNTAGQQISDMTKAFAEAASKFHAEFNATHEGVDLSLLPAAALPKSDEVGVYALLLNVFDGWAVNGACQPFDWQTLASKSPPGPGVAQVMRTVIGDTLWSKFCDKPEPAADAVVPRQLVLLAHHALRCLSIQFDNAEAEQSVKKQAQDTIDEVRTRLKRHRTA